MGSSEIPIDPMSIEASDLIVVLKDKSEWKKATNRVDLAEHMARELSVLPGVNFGFQQPIQMRFNELMTGARQDVVIKVYGENLDRLTEYANKIGQLVTQVEGAKDLYVEKTLGLPQIVVAIKRDRLAQFGLDVQTVNNAINMAFAGQSAGMVYENERRFDLVVRLEKNDRHDITDLERLFITTKTGNQVPLSQVADISLKVGPNQIQRDDAKRRIIIGFNVRGRDVESIVSELKQKVDERIKFEPGYYLTYGGAFKNLEEAKARLLVAVPAALLLIFIFLYFTFHSVRQGVMIYSSIPLAAIGGIFALWLRDMPFSVSAGVGFIALFGVAVLNGIVLVAEFNHLRSEGETNLKTILLKGTATRLRPVIITASVASLGFMPMALSMGDGAEVQRPLATVVIGGLLTSTMLTMVVLPCIFYLVETFHLKKMKTPSLIILMVCATLFALPANSQQKTVTMDEAILAAVSNNNGLKSATLDVEVQKHLKGTTTEIPKTSLMLLTGQYNSFNQDNNITLQQSIPFPTFFISQSKLLEKKIQSSEFRRASSENELIFQVKQVYLTLQYLFSRHFLLERQDSIYADMMKIATLQLKTGEGTLLQKTSAEARYNEVQNLKRQNEADQKVFINQLQILLNSQEEILPADTRLTRFSTMLTNDTAMVSKNPLLAYQRSLTDVALQEKKVEFNRALPDLTFGYFNQTLIGYQRAYNSTDQYYDSQNRFSGFMAGISIPLWFLPHQARLKSASVRAESIRQGTEYFEKQLLGQWEKAVQEFSKNNNSLDYYTRSALPNAKLILAQTQIAYKTGEISQAEYRLNLQQALSIEEGYLLSLFQFNQSIITLEFLSGQTSKNQ
ncbi:MAG TPA: efflux RND transporter permease subunit [Cyclobacteriaceae bacterium]|nr:efflux RND transporter permease subunit [Cyclobacteriaceae bacterium]